jgi:hypothetical protein
VREGPIDREGQLAHLRRRGLAHLGAEAVADVHAEEAGEGVQIAPAGAVLEIAAVAPDDHLELVAAPVAAHLGEVQPEMVESAHRATLSEPFRLRPCSPAC